MISLLLPSRKRPQVLKRMVESAFRTAKHPENVEVVVRFDDDDDERLPAQTQHWTSMGNSIVLSGPRYRAITEMWNECFRSCSGDIVCQANDDMVFTTPGWNRMVEDCFAEVEDRILLAHGNDVFGHGDKFGPHPFVHRKWVDTLGYFIPPYFCSDFGDAWVNELADRIGRRRYVAFDIEHHHYSYGLCEADENTLERLARHREDDPDSVYYSMEMTNQRIKDAEKLAKLMTSEPDITGWTPPKGTPGVLSAGKCPKCGSVMTVPHDGKLFCNCCGFAFERLRK